MYYQGNVIISRVITPCRTCTDGYTMTTHAPDTIITITSSQGSDKGNLKNKIHSFIVWDDIHVPNNFEEYNLKGMNGFLRRICA